MFVGLLACGLIVCVFALTMREGERERERAGESEREREREGESERERERKRERNRQTNEKAKTTPPNSYHPLGGSMVQAYKHTDMQTYRHTYKHTDTDIYRLHTFIHVCMHLN